MQGSSGSAAFSLMRSCSSGNAYGETTGEFEFEFPIGSSSKSGSLAKEAVVMPLTVILGIIGNKSPKFYSKPMCLNLIKN